MAVNTTVNWTAHGLVDPGPYYWDGKIYVVGRSMSSATGLKIVVSEDDGQTWSNPQTTMHFTPGAVAQVDNWLYVAWTTATGAFYRAFDLGHENFHVNYTNGATPTYSVPMEEPPPPRTDGSIPVQMNIDSSGNVALAHPYPARIMGTDYAKIAVSIHDPVADSWVTAVRDPDVQGNSYLGHGFANAKVDQIIYMDSSFSWRYYDPATGDWGSVRGSAGGGQASQSEAQWSDVAEDFVYVRGFSTTRTEVAYLLGNDQDTIITNDPSPHEDGGMAASVTDHMGSIYAFTVGQNGDLRYSARQAGWDWMEFQSMEFRANRYLYQPWGWVYLRLSVRAPNGSSLWSHLVHTNAGNATWHVYLCEIRIGGEGGPIYYFDANGGLVTGGWSSAGSAFNGSPFSSASTATSGSEMIGTGANTPQAEGVAPGRAEVRARTSINATGYMDPWWTEWASILNTFQEGYESVEGFPDNIIALNTRSFGDAVGIIYKTTDDETIYYDVITVATDFDGESNPAIANASGVQAQMLAELAPVEDFRITRETFERIDMAWSEEDLAEIYEIERQVWVGEGPPP